METSVFKNEINEWIPFRKRQEEFRWMNTSPGLWSTVIDFLVINVLNGNNYAIESKAVHRDLMKSNPLVLINSDENFAVLIKKM